MDSKIVNINKEACITVINNQLELFTQAIIKKNKEIIDLKHKLDDSQRERVKLARAYAKKIGVLKPK